jgi:hypothetical protein
MASSADLTPQQRDALISVLRRQSSYLHRLVRRMQTLGWPKDDPMFARALRARDAVLSLLEGCKPPPKPTNEEPPAWVTARG